MGAASWCLHAAQTLVCVALWAVRLGAAALPCLLSASWDDHHKFSGLSSAVLSQLVLLTKSE